MMLSNLSLGLWMNAVLYLFHPEVSQVVCVKVSTNQHLSVGIEVACLSVWLFYG